MFPTNQSRDVSDQSEHRCFRPISESNSKANRQKPTLKHLSFQLLNNIFKDVKHLTFLSFTLRVPWEKNVT